MLYECYSPLCVLKFDHPCSFSPTIGQYLFRLYPADTMTVELYLDLVTLIVDHTEGEEVFVI